MNDTKTQLDSIQEAYMGVITEGKEAKFKVGDKVGIGIHLRTGEYHPENTGVVSKVDKHGQHTVDFDSNKPSSVYKELFDHTGSSSIPGMSHRKIVQIDYHTSSVDNRNNQHTRNSDLDSVSGMLSGRKNGFGDHPKLSKEHAAHIKSLLDKHTEE